MIKSLNEQLERLKGKAVWLASYPKSGNTWFRCFISALIDKEININKLSTDGILSSRKIFSDIHDINSRYLKHDELLNRLPNLYSYYIGNAPSLLFIKVHEAYVSGSQNRPIIPAPQTHKAVYIVRNPLDIVASFANHNNTSLDNTITLMNNKSGTLGGKINGIHATNQFPQIMYDWSGHVNSWLDQSDIDTIILRYEDMKDATKGAFHKTIEDLNLGASENEITAAIEMTAFDRLKTAESKDGFREKNASSKRFFRQGLTNQWSRELTLDQAKRIIDAHGPTMERLNYEIPDLDNIYSSHHCLTK